jgi:hypothetical protein
VLVIDMVRGYLPFHRTLVKCGSRGAHSDRSVGKTNERIAAPDDLAMWAKVQRLPRLPPKFAAARETQLLPQI